MKMLVSAFRFLSFSNIYLAICVLAFTAKTSVLLYGNCGSAKVNMLVFFATLFLYGFHQIYHRSKIIPEERVEDRHNWVDRYKMVVWVTTGVSFVAAAILMLCMPMRMWLMLAPLLFFGLGYSLPVIPTHSGWKRLRDNRWLKTAWVALGYAWLTTFTPVVYQASMHAMLTNSVLFVFVRSFLFAFALVLPFDIRDIPHDLKNGMKTIPVLLGPGKTVRLALTLLSVFVLLVWVQYVWFQISAGFAIALIVSAAEAAVVVSLSKKTKPDLFYTFAIENSMAFQFVIVLLAVLFA